MRLVVLVFNRSSLCFFRMIVQAVARWMPSAFACASKEVYPAATQSLRDVLNVGCVFAACARFFLVQKSEGLQALA